MEPKGSCCSEVFLPHNASAINRHLCQLNFDPLHSSLRYGQLKVVDWENKNRFSSYQKAIMVNCFVYFIFNMLIVPGFAATAFSNLYELLGEGIKNTGQLFRELFSLDSGDFFVILIIQQAGVSFMIQITSIVDLFTYYLSPFITLNMRVILSGKEAWRKTNKTIFEYGLAYAQQLVIAAIGIVFR